MSNLRQLQALILLLALSPLTLCQESLTCLDTDQDLKNTDWFFSPSLKYCAEGSSSSCLPAHLNELPEGSGVWYHKPRVTVDIVSWQRKVHGNEYVFLRYYNHRPGPSKGPDYISPTVTSSDGDLEQTADFEWKEACFKLNDAVDILRTVRVSPNGTTDDVIVIDKIAYVVLPNSEISCGPNDTYEIQRFCNFIEPTVPTTSPQPPTSTAAPPCGTGGHLVEWIDSNSNLEALPEWKPPASLKYAATEADLPSAELASRIKGKGIFYFGGNPWNEQVFQRLAVPHKKYRLALRYYVHHTSDSSDQVYFVHPAPGLFQLDTTQDFTWKEVSIVLESDEEFNLRIGTFGTDPEDLLLIDEIIFVQQNTGHDEL